MKKRLNVPSMSLLACLSLIFSLGFPFISQADECSASSVPEPLKRLCVSFQTALANSLTWVGVSGWQFRRDTHASWVFRVDNARERWADTAHDETVANQSLAVRYFTNAENITDFLYQVSKLGGGTEGLDPSKLSFPTRKRLSDLITTALSSSEDFFQDLGYLGTVGWDGADQESPRGWIPLGPIRTASRLMSGLGARNTLWGSLISNTHNDKNLAEIQFFLAEAIGRNPAERLALVDLLVPAQFRCQKMLQEAGAFDPQI